MNAIENAAHEVWFRVATYTPIPDEEEIAAIIKRELEKAVPARDSAYSPDECHHQDGYNECRRAFLGE